MKKKEEDILRELEAFSSPQKTQIDPFETKIPSTQIADSSSSSNNIHPQTLLEENRTEGCSSTLSFHSSLPSVNQRYEIRKILGEGGMGIVQLVYDNLLGREVALKQIKLSSKKYGSSHQKGELFLRLLQEAEITAKLEHPNIVPLYEMQQKGAGEIQFTMRKIEGKSLREVLIQIRQHPETYEERRLLSIFLKVCDAIAYAHSKGVVHRDLKPDNIMVGDYGEVYVMDWGIAKQLCSEPSGNILTKALETSTSLPFSNTLHTEGGMGTPGYMAPEQRDISLELTNRADIYALGKVLREIFILMGPVEELQSEVNSRIYRKQKRLSGTILPFSGTLPKDIDAICKKATQINPEKRYSSVMLLAKDVEHYLQNFQVSVRKYSLFEIVQKLIQRHRKNLLIISVSFLIGVLLFFYMQHLSYQNKLHIHQKRLQYWLEKLQNPQKGFKQSALLEINKMREPEICEVLIPLLKEGTQYYLKSQTRIPSLLLKNYFNMMVDFLHWINFLVLLR